MSTLFAPPRFTPVSGNGTTYPAALLYFTITGTSTPKNTYSDAGLTTPNANPVVADANGLFGPIYLTSGDYKVILKDASLNTIWTVDPQPGLGAGDALTTRGDLLTRDASGYKRLAIGTATQVLTSDGVDVGWASPILPRTYIQGLTYINAVADVTNDITVAIGCAMEGTNVRMLVLAAALTKRLDAAWVVGDNQGGLDTGSIGNSEYYIWLIQRSDTGVVDVLFSLSATAPTMPTNYTFKRVIGWFKRTGAVNLPLITQEGGGGALVFRYVTPISDVALANTLTTTRRTDAISVPKDFSVFARVRVLTYDVSSDHVEIVGSTSETDAAPASLATAAMANQGGITGDLSVNERDIITSATGTIAARSSLATVDVYGVTTLGFTWARR